MQQRLRRWPRALPKVMSEKSELASPTKWPALLLWHSPLLQRNPDEGGSKAKRKRGKRDRGPAPKRQRPTTIGHSALGENVVKVRCSLMGQASWGRRSGASCTQFAPCAACLNKALQGDLLTRVFCCGFASTVPYCMGSCRWRQRVRLCRAATSTLPTSRATSESLVEGRNGDRLSRSEEEQDATRLRLLCK